MSVGCKSAAESALLESACWLPLAGSFGESVVAANADGMTPSPATIDMMEWVDSLFFCSHIEYLS